MTNSASICRFFARFGVNHCANAAQLFIERPIKILFILVLAFLASRFGARLTHRFITSLGSHSAVQARSARAPRRAYALASTSASVTRVIVWIIAAPLLLGELGLNLAPFIATATVIGAALGFGAQTLVKDLLSGFTILVEDQYGVGDRIALPTNGLSGVVEDVTLMRTRIRADDGKVWFIANGDIREVANLSLEWVRATVDVVLPYDADLDRAIEMATEEAAAMAGEPDWSPLMLSHPEVYGETMDQSSITMRVTARTPPGTTAGVRRALLVRILGRLRGDAGPVPAGGADGPGGAGGGAGGGSGQGPAAEVPAGPASEPQPAAATNQEAGTHAPDPVPASGPAAAAEADATV